VRAYQLKPRTVRPGPRQTTKRIAERESRKGASAEWGLSAWLPFAKENRNQGRGKAEIGPSFFRIGDERPLGGRRLIEWALCKKHTRKGRGK